MRIRACGRMSGMFSSEGEQAAGEGTCLPRSPPPGKDICEIYMENGLGGKKTNSRSSS